jgi:hypothetical protein
LQFHDRSGPLLSSSIFSSSLRLRQIKRRHDI